MAKTRQEILDKLAKMEALAKSTTSPSEAGSARSIARRIREKYADLLAAPAVETKPSSPRRPQAPPPKQWFHKKFLIPRISVKRYRQILAAIQKTSAIPQEDESEIKWLAEIFSRRIFLFFYRRRIDLHMVFSSTSRYTLECVIQEFLKISNLDIK